MAHLPQTNLLLPLGGYFCKSLSRAAWGLQAPRWDVRWAGIARRHSVWKTSLDARSICLSRRNGGIVMLQIVDNHATTALHSNWRGRSGCGAPAFTSADSAERKRLMASRVAAVWHFQNSAVDAEKWHQVVFRSGLRSLQIVGRFVRAFLEVEPIFLKRF